MIKSIKYILLLSISFIFSFGIFAQESRVSKYIDQVDSVNIRMALATLSSDKFEGRGTGKPGGLIAEKYIAAYLDSCGIKPGNNNSYFQNINGFKSFNVVQRRFVVNNVDYPNDYNYENLYNQDTALHIDEIIFIVSSGAESNLKLDLEKNIGANKVIMKLNDMPSGYVDRQNPKTIINIYSDFKSVPVTVSEKTYFNPPNNKYKYNKVSISTNLADKLLKSHGKTLKQLIEEVEKSGTPQILTLKTSVLIYGNVKYEKMNVNNIIGIIEGSDRKDEYIVLSAHHDHVGIINGEIYNGADDNASGVSSVLEIARLLAKAKKEGNELQRSIIVLFPAAEELGLIGSSYYVRNPVFPLSNTKACVNVDMVGRIDNKYKSTNGDYIYVVNDAKTNGKLLEYVEKANNDNIIVNVEDLNSLFRRSDHYNFAKNDVPAALLTSGLHGDYHTPRDDAELIDFRAMWKRSRFILSLIWSLAN